MRMTITGVALVCWSALIASAQPPGSQPAQTEADEYTSYELLAPERQQFRILYDVTATTPGARFYFNTIRKGSEATDERVTDLANGAELPFAVVAGSEARTTGHPAADLDTNYIKVSLPRAVPADGEVRIRIDKTYKDPKSYYREGDTIVFARTLGIKRNKVVLPAGYELVACNMPAQVFPEADGRIAISFFNANPDPVSLVVKARPLPPRATPGAAASAASFAGESPAPPTSRAEPGVSLAEAAATLASERALQDREIVYFLQQPDTHAFDLYHDYTERREGTAVYLNVVRAGSRVSKPSARVLDTGETLRTEILRGDEITRANLDIGETVTGSTEVVVIRFAPVVKGQSVRLRIAETYTDPARYGLVGEHLVWNRSFGRPRNAMVLPAGWYLVASAIPATVSLTDDGRVRLDFINARPDEIDVLVKARRR